MKAKGVTGDLFEDSAAVLPPVESLGEGAVLLRGFATGHDEQLQRELKAIAQVAPFRHLVTPTGQRMSVAMTNCGPYGWISDRRGYRYESIDPDSAKPWPALPGFFLDLAQRAATEAGYPNFVPDACLINRYEPGSRLTLHQDKNERDFKEPIVSVSFGLPAVFLFGGHARADRPRRVRLIHGDVAVWGGPSRLNFHGIAPLADGDHPFMGPYRINLTLRRAR
ncbi:MAG: DNA oxidative demethylase AlkB [Vicinamibacteria bacterium]